MEFERKDSENITYDEMTDNTNEEESVNAEPQPEVHIVFGVDSKVKANELLQNNITVFEWASRNKLTPAFWGRNIVGENKLTKEEVEFLRDQACKIAALCSTSDTAKTDEQGEHFAAEIIAAAAELGIPKGSAIFLEIGDTEAVTRDYMRGFARKLINEGGYTPGFKANTDAKYDFDHQFSRGIQTDKDIFSKCIIWATAPHLDEYDRITTSHLIHPGNWIPFAPSGITRKDIAVWQYGSECHPIDDNKGEKTSFNIDLVINEQVIIEKMF